MGRLTQLLDMVTSFLRTLEKLGGQRKNESESVTIPGETYNQFHDSVNELERRLREEANRRNR